MRVVVPDRLSLVLHVHAQIRRHELNIGAVLLDKVIDLDLHEGLLVVSHNPLPRLIVTDLVEVHELLLPDGGAVAIELLAKLELRPGVQAALCIANLHLVVVVLFILMLVFREDEAAAATSHFA